MNWVDLAVLAVIAVSALMGLARGMVREVLGLAAWAGALFVAITYFGPAQIEARKLIANPDIADPAAFGVLFLGVLIAASLLARLIGGAIRGSVLGGLDRTLGLAFGVARGAVLLLAAYVIGGMLIPVDRWPPPVLEARSLPSIYQGAVWAAERIPAGYRPHLTPPPPGRTATAAQLLHATPAGTALGPPVVKEMAHAAAR